MNNADQNPMKRRWISRGMVLVLGLMSLGSEALARDIALPGQPLPLQPNPPALVTPKNPLHFPNAYGSHPNFPIEWWYITGWLHTHSGQPLGFQITFFRVRPAKVWANPSAFNPRQLIFAEAAISDPHMGHLLTAQSAARAGLGLAGAEPHHTQVWIRHWFLRQVDNDSAYDAQIHGKHLSMKLHFSTTQPPLLEGPLGISQKGPDPQNASYYYSIPHLKVSGSVTIEGHPESVHGEAWLDHEWSAAYLPKAATGWDWVGLNLKDGKALMVFMMRRSDGTPLWLAATERSAHGQVRYFPSDQIHMQPSGWWKSPKTGIRYPVRWRLQVGKQVFHLQPLMDNQEFDANRSTGTVYWEGAVRATENGKGLGQGYLEMTGYGGHLSLP